MPPLTPLILTRLAPHAPLLLRDDGTVQFGIDGAPTVRADEEWIEPLLRRLRAGFRRSSFDVIAHAAGAPRAAARDLLAMLEPLLVDDPPPLPRVWVEAGAVRDARCAHRLREALADERVAAGDLTRADDVAVIVLPGTAAALQLAPYLRDDIPHLPIAVERRRAVVGPLVVPGRTPCLACRDGHARDRDPAWPLLHAQMIGRDPGPVSVALIAGAGAAAAALLAAGPAASTVVTLAADGSRATTEVPFHEGCRCREPSSRSPRGSATAPARPDRPTSPSSATGFAQLA